MRRVVYVLPVVALLFVLGGCDMFADKDDYIPIWEKKVDFWFGGDYVVDYEPGSMSVVLPLEGRIYEGRAPILSVARGQLIMPDTMSYLYRGISVWGAKLNLPGSFEYRNGDVVNVAWEVNNNNIKLSFLASDSTISRLKKETVASLVYYVYAE